MMFYSRPRYDGHDPDTYDDGALDLESHQEGNENAAKGNPYPHLKRSYDVNTPLRTHAMNIRLTAGFAMIWLTHSPFSS